MLAGDSHPGLFCKVDLHSPLADREDGQEVEERPAAVVGGAKGKRLVEGKAVGR